MTDINNNVRYEVFKEEKGMLHGWHDCSVIEYEKYPDDKKRIIELKKNFQGYKTLETWGAGYDRAYWEMNPEADFPPLSRKDYIEKIEVHSHPITPEEIEELKSFEFYPHSDKSLKVLGEDYEGGHYGKEDINRLIELFIKYIS